MKYNQKACESFEGDYRLCMEQIRFQIVYEGLSFFKHFEDEDDLR